MAMDPEVEKAFALTCKVLLGKEAGSIASLAPWLSKGVRLPTKIKSAKNKQDIYLSYFKYYPMFKEWAIGLDEWEEFGKKSIRATDLEKLNMENAGKLLGDTRYFCLDAVVGNNVSVTEASTYGFSTHCCMGDAFVYSKYCAYSMWPRSSEHAFGCDFLFNSAFCIRCFHSINLNRCFESAYCTDCSDCYFCFNCENCQNCLFSFNAKNLRFAVCNVEVGKEEYARIKKMLLDDINAKLGKDRKLEYSIYSIGAGKK